MSYEEEDTFVELDWDIQARDRLLLVDYNNLLIRCVYGLRPDLRTEDGTLVHGVYGFLKALYSVTRTHRIDKILCANDSCKSKHRLELFPDYKAQRIKEDKRTEEEKIEFSRQWNLTEELLRALEISVVKSMEEHEADDILGTLAHKYKDEYDVYILSGDLDFTQLIEENILMVRPLRGGKSRVYNKKVFRDEYGFDPINMIDYKALTGDASDNIPGVKRVGDVTGKKLIQQYQTVENLYENIEQITGALKENLVAGKDLVDRNKQLVKILTCVPINYSDYQLTNVDFQSKRVKEFYSKYEFESFYVK